MYDVFKELNSEEVSILRERLNNLGISDQEINSVNLPYTIIESISDEELLRQVNMRKSLDDNSIETKTEHFSLKDDREEFIREKLSEAASSLPPIQTISDEEFVQIQESPYLEDREPIEQIDKKYIEVVKPKVRRRKKKEVIKEESINKVDEDDDIDDSDDLFDIPILNVSTMHAYDNYNRFSSVNTPTYEVVLPQSGYCAKMRGMTADEIDILRNSINTSYQSSRDDLTEIVFRCIKDTGIQGFNRQKFESNTALLDFNILLFGILHQTYGVINSFDFTCPHCQHNFKKDIVTQSLIQTKSEKVGEIVNEISNGLNKAEMFERSLLKTFAKRIRIPDTDLIIEIGLGDINKDKRISSYFTKLTDKERNTRKFFLTNLIKKLLLPQYDINGGITGYVEVTSPSDIYKFLDPVKTKSYNKIIPKINTILDDFTIAFKMPDIPCPSCQRTIEGSSVDMADYFLLETIRDGFVEETKDS